MNLRKLSILFRRVNPWQTLRINFRYLPLKVAIRLPIMVFWRTQLLTTKGRVVIDAPIETGMVKIGPHGVGTIDRLFTRTVWDVSGTLVFRGKASIGRGTKVSVGPEGTLTLGNGFLVTGNSEIVCHKEICFGADCLLSWDVLLMDTDLHHVLDGRGTVVNPPKPIRIGNHVWIGCRNTILKGVSVADGCVLAAGSTLTRSVEEPHSVVGGHGKDVSVLKHDIVWREN